MENITKDGIRAVAGTEVYGINPWAGVETLYVHLDQVTASTCEPSEEGGADRCTLPVSICYASEDTAFSVACTYVEDHEGFMVPPKD